MRGVMELDLIYSGAAIGKKGERSACASIAMAVDAASGMVLAPEVADSSVAAGDTLAKVFLKAIQGSPHTAQGGQSAQPKVDELPCPAHGIFRRRGSCCQQAPGL